jgi:hypothetical protein
MKQRISRGFSAADKTELWDRWQRGKALKAIGRALGKSALRSKRTNVTDPLRCFAIASTEAPAVSPDCVPGVPLMPRSLRQLELEDRAGRAG